jgi:predicted  nucleic acid-binding Zn-ribbon protein
MGETAQQGTDARLADNEYIKDLFAILQDYGRDSGGLSALLNHVGEMESFVRRAEDRIADMKTQLDAISEIQNHPLKAALQKAIKALEATVTEVKQRISELKDNIIDGCRDAMAAFRERGVTALDNLASFFHVREGLQAMKNNLVADMNVCDKSLADINSFAREYHSAGRHLKNMVRVAIGKKPVDVSKEAGRVAKAVSVPFKAHKAILSKLKNAVDSALGKLSQLENTELAKHAERELVKKPSLLGKLEANKERVAREQREKPVPEREIAQGVEV